MLGHEVVAETADGRRVALVHHLPCGECARCLAGHESTCEAFEAPTIRPGGFAERASDGRLGRPPGRARRRARDDGRAARLRAARASSACRTGRVLVVGHGFVGRLFAAVLARRGDEVFAVDRDPRRSGPRAGRPRRRRRALRAGRRRGGARPRWSRAGRSSSSPTPGAIPAAPVYRRELTVAGSRSATPETCSEAAALLPELDLPEPTVLPLERFAEGLELYRRGEALKVVFTP